MLKDLLNWEKIMNEPRCAGGHSDIMNNLFMNAKVVASHIENEYQGNEAFAYKIANGRYVLVTDYFGSCSGCDAWEDASNEEVRNLCIQLANNAHEFKSVGRMIDFIIEHSDSAELYDIRHAVPLAYNLIGGHRDRRVIFEKY
jgi:hypothetical protein